MQGILAAKYGDEIRSKFNLHYDNILSAASPGINDYELSLYMTQAQREVLLSYYSGYNSKGEAFENNEKVRSLITYYSKESKIPFSELTDPLYPETNTFAYKEAVLPAGVWFLLKENLVFNPGYLPDKEKYTPIKPITQDDFWVLAENPHKRPDKYLTRAWRMDGAYFTAQGTDLLRSVKLIYTLGAPLVSYNFTYLQIPEPIIVSNLEDSGTGLIVEGIEVIGDASINIPDPLIKDHQLRDIVIDRAVELATRDYKQNNLEAQMSMNNRAE